MKNLLYLSILLLSLVSFGKNGEPKNIKDTDSAYFRLSLRGEWLVVERVKRIPKYEDMEGSISDVGIKRYVYITKYPNKKLDFYFRTSSTRKETILEQGHDLNDVKIGYKDKFKIEKDHYIVILFGGETLSKLYLKQYNGKYRFSYNK